MEAYALKVEPFTRPDGPKARALKPSEEAAEASGAWRASGIDGAGSIAPGMREDIVHGCLDVIQPCVNPIDGIGTADAEPHGAARKAYASNVERGRYDPYRTGGLRPLFSKESCCKVDTRLLGYSQGN